MLTISRAGEKVTEPGKLKRFPFAASRWQFPWKVAVMVPMLILSRRGEKVTGAPEFNPGDTKLIVPLEVKGNRR